MDTTTLVGTVCPKIAAHGWAFFFAPETTAVGEELGLDPLQFYAVGRGGVLGDVDADVITSAFGYFNPTYVRPTWEAAAAICSPRAAARLWGECAAVHGRAKLADIPALDAFCAAANAVNRAADPVGLPLYAGWRAEPLADDLPGQAMQLLNVLRELRGSAHLLAVRAASLEPITAHFVAHPEMFTVFGWAEADTPEVTADDRTKWNTAEALTDALLAPAFGVLDDAGQKAMLDGMEAVEDALIA